jgi:outer membrane lipoprotein SlyB
MVLRFLVIIGILFFSVGSVQASHKQPDKDYNTRYDKYDNDDDGFRRENNIRYDRRNDDNGFRRENNYRNKHNKRDYRWRRHHRQDQYKKAAKHHRKQHKKVAKARKRYYENYRKHSHYRELPAWAHRCGLPPGIAKRHKIPRGWKRRCLAGQKYYDHRHDFRDDIYAEQRVVYRDQPAYQTVYEMDTSECEAQSIHTAGNVAEGVAIGAVFGGIIGAAGGAIIGSTGRGGAGRGAATGAIGGAVGGAVLGGILASNDYKHDYNQCMRERGHWRN